MDPMDWSGMAGFKLFEGYEGISISKPQIISRNWETRGGKQEEGKLAHGKLNREKKKIILCNEVIGQKVNCPQALLPEEFGSRVRWIGELYVTRTIWTVRAIKRYCPWVGLKTSTEPSSAWVSNREDWHMWSLVQSQVKGKVELFTENS